MPTNAKYLGVFSQIGAVTFLALQLSRLMEQLPEHRNIYTTLQRLMRFKQNARKCTTIKIRCKNILRITWLTPCLIDGNRPNLLLPVYFFLILCPEHHAVPLWRFRDLSDSDNIVPFENTTTINQN